MESWFGISFGNTNIAGILYFILNIPLLAVSVKRFGKEFLAKTIYCVCWYSLFLTVVPIADHLLVDEHLTACVAGGVICGIGAGMTLLSGGSGGGEEILGLLLMQKHSNLSVGKVSAMLNIFIFGTCCGNFQYFPGNLFSFVLRVSFIMLLDKVHFQNINADDADHYEKARIGKDNLRKKSIVALQNGMLMVHIEMKKEKF